MLSKIVDGIRPEPDPEEGRTTSMVGCEVLALAGVALFGGILLMLCSMVSGAREGLGAVLAALWG